MRSLVLAPVAFIVGLAVACGGSDESGGGDSPGSDESNATSTARAIPQGEYLLIEDRAREATLTVESSNATELKFKYSIVNLFGGHNMGDLENAVAKPKNGKWVYEDASIECKMVLTPAADTFTLEQEGGCSFGANVLGNGKYKKNLPAEKPAIGDYKLTGDDSRGGTLSIKEILEGSTVKFSLSVVNNFGGNNMGDIEDGYAQNEFGSWTYRDIDDPESTCHIGMKVSGNVIELEQTGDCQFGANVVAGGKYKKN
jgi:hypothetical protein